MSFDSIETSEFFEPQELYHFQREGDNWYYTSGDSDITFGGSDYLASPMKRSKVSSTQDLGKTLLKISTSRRNSFAGQFINSVPTGVISVTVFRIHASDAGADSAVTFKGRVVNISHQENIVVITCQQNSSVLRNPGLRRLYQTTCPHVLYGGYCSVARSAFLVSADLSSVDGLTLTSSSFSVSINAAFDAEWFVGGIVEILVGGVTNRRFITEHNNGAGTITLNLPLEGASSGSTVFAYPGCNRDPSTCSGKFSNIENYGGFPFIPSKNPMDGTPIF